MNQFNEQPKSETKLSNKELIISPTEQIFGKEIQPENLITIRKFLNDVPIGLDENGKITCNRKEDLNSKRNTIHTTLNYPVESHQRGSWKDSNTMILSPYTEMVKENGKPVNLAWQDTFWWDEIKYSDKSIVITADETIKNKLGNEHYEVIYVPELKDLPLEEKEMAFKKICIDEMNKRGFKIVEHDSLTGSINNDYERLLKDFANKSKTNFGIGSDNWTEKLDEHLGINAEQDPKKAILETVKNRFSYKKNKVKRDIIPLLKSKRVFDSAKAEKLSEEKRNEILEKYKNIKEVKNEKYSIPIHIFEKIAEKLTPNEVEDLLLQEEQGRQKYLKKEVDIYPQFTREERDILQKRTKNPI